MKPAKAYHEPKIVGLQTVGPSVIIGMPVRVSHELDTVVLDINGTVLTMEYPYAIAIAEKLRLHGKQAKKWNGDKGKHWSTEGSLLTDAEENYKRGF